MLRARIPPPFLLVLLALVAAVSDCGTVLVELEALLPVEVLGLVELGLVALGLLGFALDGWSVCGWVLWLLGLLGVAGGCC